MRLHARVYTAAVNAAVNMSLVYIGVPAGQQRRQWKRRDLIWGYYTLFNGLALLCLFVYAMATGNVESLGKRYN